MQRSPYAREGFGSLRNASVCECRERQEKAENKARAAAETNWRNLLRSIFTRIKVQGDYADEPDTASGAPCIVFISFDASFLIFSSHVTSCSAALLKYKGL